MLAAGGAVSSLAANSRYLSNRIGCGSCTDNETTAMSQLNMNVTEAFQEDLRRPMKLRDISTKADAIRTAVREAVERAARPRRRTDFRDWVGEALRAKLNPQPRFHSDDDLWG